MLPVPGARTAIPWSPPPTPLRGGPAGDATTLRGLIGRVDGPVVLIGHSYGGSVISAAGAGNDQVKALVFVAAFLPAPGRTALELTNRYPGSP
ncbi:alpha/beta fold hydrolase [Nocardia sp. NPDC049526]|uniref:alpha/beta fold hydrolase n=1 Tax=Nocardia sp. NPDC049526 TaxID=3364316 RepID=UPI0037BA7C8C